MSAIFSSIHALLAEPLATAAEREQRTFPTLLRETDGSVVLFGAGRLGRLCARALRRGGVKLRAFCDSDRKLHGATVEGVEVVGPEQAVERFGGSALFVAAIWTGTARENMMERIDFLRRIGCRHVANYAPLVWALGGDEVPFHAFDLPTRVLAHGTEIVRLAAILDDDHSQATLLAALRQRVRGEFDKTPPVAGQYFPQDILAPRADEILVDGGAYTGDTLQIFLERTGSMFGEYHAFEPDPANLEQLRARVLALPEPVRAKVRIHECALHSRSEELGFSGDAGLSSRVEPSGRRRVQGRALDEALAGRRVTFLKLDIEGAEREALLGARSALAQNQPAAAVCVYHGPTDLWEIPLMLHERLPQHRLFLRQHGFDGWETVAYTVPPERCLALK